MTFLTLLEFVDRLSKYKIHGFDGDFLRYAYDGKEFNFRTGIATCMHLTGTPNKRHNSNFLKTCCQWAKQYPNILVIIRDNRKTELSYVPICDLYHDSRVIPSDISMESILTEKYETEKSKLITFLKEKNRCLTVHEIFSFCDTMSFTQFHQVIILQGKAGNSAYTRQECDDKLRSVLSILPKSSIKYNEYFNIHHTIKVYSKD